MEKIGRFMLGAIMGGLFATAIVILLTPTSGAKVRHEITGRIDSIRQEVKMAAENRRKELEVELKQLQHPD
jgi:gas vesicle protein